MRRGSVLGVGLVVAVAAGASAIVLERDAMVPVAAAAAEPLPAQEARSPLQSEVQDGLDVSRRTAIVEAAERVAPAVVSVNTIVRERVRPRTLWEEMFNPYGTEREVPGLGTGFILREDGLVLTNEHVVTGAARIVVSLPDGREFEAEVVGADELNDVALLRLELPEGTTLPVAPIGRSDDLLIGEWVVAIGNPFGFYLANPEPAVSAGVVSALHRNILPSGDQRGVYLDMIQTDASINPGNSGGPLVNALGQVIGVNSSIISRSGGSEGLGFAIPIDRARRIALDLLDDGRVRRAWVGIEVEPDEAATRLGQRRRIRIARVVPGSPAERAGLRAGMVLSEAEGRTLRSPLDWEARLLDAAVGSPLRLSVVEGDATRAVRVVPADLPSLGAERIRALEDFELITVTPAIRAERGIRSEGGALIVALSEAARRQLGLRAGDVIVQVNRQPIRSAEEAAHILQRLTGSGAVRLFFERGGECCFQTSFYING